MGSFEGYTLLTTNVGGMRDQAKQDMVFESCEENEAGTNILIETHLDESHRNQIRG